LNWNSDWWQHLLAFALGLGFGIGLYAINWLGGGDAKFIAALAFAFDLEGLLRFLVLTSFAGAILAIVMFAPAVLKGRREDAKRHNLPYGVAIAAGAILTWTLSPQLTLLAE
jgi:prepilin peptidase CpaA